MMPPASGTRIVALLVCVACLGCQTVPRTPSKARFRQESSSQSLPSRTERSAAPALRAAERDVSTPSDNDSSRSIVPAAQSSPSSAVRQVAAEYPLKAGGWPSDPAGAERREQEGSVLTLDELQQLALSGNPTLRQAEALVQQAYGNWLQSGLYPNPVLGYDGTGNNGAFDQQGGFLSQNIVTANKLALNREVASHDRERSRWEAEAQLLRVMNEIQIRYVAALGAQRKVEVAADLVKVADEGVEISEQLLEGEQVSRADVLQARLQQSQTELLLRSARFQAAATWKQLGNVLGSSEFPVRPLDGNLTEDFPEVDYDAAWQQLIHGSPLLHAAAERVAAAAAQVHREEAQLIPDVRVAGMVWRDTINPPTMMYGLNLGVALPVFDRNQGNISAARSQLHAARAEVARLELVLRDSLADAFRRYQSARTQVDTYRDLILPTAEENLDLTLKGYEEGELDFLRVLTARRDLFESKINYVTALVDFRIVTIEIRGLLLTGGLNAVDSKPVPANQAGQTTGPGN